MKKYLLFILILFLGTSIDIAPEEGHFNYSKETAKGTTSFATWIETHNLANEKDKEKHTRTNSEAELLAILDSGLSFNMPLPLIGASEGLVLLSKQEYMKEIALKEEKAKEEILKAEQEKAEALAEQEQAEADKALLLAQKALEEAKIEKEALEQKELEEKLLLEAQKEAIIQAEKLAEEQKLIAQNQSNKEKIEEEKNKPNALENNAEKETTDTSLEASNVVKTEETKPVIKFPQELPAENVEMIQYSTIQEGNSYVAVFTLLNKTDDVQAGRIHYSISFADGKTMPFDGYVGTYRFKMQVPKNYPLALSQEMLDHAKVSEPRLITIYLLNHRDEVFFRKNIMITN